MRRGARLLRDEEGGALVEFVLVLPLMILMLVGAVELVAGFQAQRKAYHVAFTVADIVAQSGMTSSDTLTKSQLADDMVAGQALMDPLPVDAGSLTQTVASVTADSKGAVKVDWVYPDGASITVPSGLLKANQSLVVAQADYAYRPFSTYVWPASTTLTFSKQAYLQPRYLKTVPAPK